jgi:exonuclease III
MEGAYARQVRIVSWNVARRSSRLPEQAAALSRREPDVIALQEITDRTLPLWRAALTRIGLPNVRASLDGADPARAPALRRRTGVLLSARGPLVDAAAALPMPWPETTIAAVASAEASGPVELHCVHVPNAANGWVKVRTLEAIRGGLAAAPPGPRVLCGDLNTPRRELDSGEVISFARDSRGRLRPERGPEWDNAELGVVPRLRELGYRDAFRALNGYASREPSWTWQRIAGHDGGWRLDHLFASQELRPTAATYHHAWRDQGLSDHSALEVDLQGRRRELTREPEGHPRPR